MQNTLAQMRKVEHISKFKVSLTKCSYIALLNKTRLDGQIRPVPFRWEKCKNILFHFKRSLQQNYEYYTFIVDIFPLITGTCKLA